MSELIDQSSATESSIIEHSQSSTKPDASDKKDDLNIGDYSINQDDLFLVGDAEIDAKGLVSHNISSADDLYIKGLPQIITKVFKVEKDIINQRNSSEEDKSIESINVVITFTDVFISKPTMINYYSGKEEVLYPNVALAEDKTYSANLRVNAKIKATALMKNGSKKERNDEIKNFKLCRIPIMKGSVLCNTHKLTKSELMNMHEDPTDPGGYFIIKGIEWAIDCVENILFNQIRIFKNEGYSKEVMRVEFISRPGDTYQNSDYFLMRLLNDNQLTCEIASGKLKGIQLPFYILFRVLGWSDDKTMFDNIIYGYDSDISKNMFNYITDSMNAKYASVSNGRYVYDQTDVLKLIIDELKYTEFKYLELDSNKDNYQMAVKIVNRLLDVNFLPHVGITQASRPDKLRYLALIIRKICLVRIGIIPPTDRDSENGKRVLAAGTSYAKSFKTYFNASIIQQIKRRLVKDFKSISFSLVDLVSSVKSSIYGADFEKSIMQTITSGNKSQITINKQVRTNRLSSQLLDRKNQIAVYSTLRQVSANSSDSGKQSERANEMRRVHMSFIGYICIIHSPDGEKVGINKQLALFATILEASSRVVIKDILMLDKDIIKLSDVTPGMIHKNNLNNVYVNGEWIGCTKDALAFCIKYRKLRRLFKINPMTTIHWDNTQDEAYFWVDVGRLCRPLMIVYNNKRDPERFSKKYNEKNFTQGIAVDQNIIDGLKNKTIDIEYMLKNNIIEYITPEEQENCYICPYFDQLNENKNNELNEYTHCDIPQAILGITALTSPYANHNQTPRITFQTSQCKQTCGVFTLNWPYRCDKDTFLQYICETPLVKTVASKYIFPNGNNVIVAIACYSGFNQEDSLVVSQGAIDRGLFNGSKFTFYKDELDQKEEFANPDITTTSEIKSGSYSKLKNGIIKVGTVINKGDAIIGKIMRLPKTNNTNITNSDRSTIYKENEEAIVHNVIVDRNDDDERFAKIAIRKIRPVAIGDKFCLTKEHDVLTTCGWKNITDITIYDLVATLNTSNNNIEFQYPTETPSFYHNGLMYKVKNNNVNLITTLNHKMYVKMLGDTNYQSIEAEKIYNKQVYYKKTGINNLCDISTFTIPCDMKYEIEKHILNMDDWLDFLGIYVSNGYINNDNTILIHFNPIIEHKIKSILDKLNYKYQIFIKYINYISISDNLLSSYLSKLGTLNKRKLPDWCYTLSHRQSSILVNSILLSDGYYNQYNHNHTYNTSSKYLVDGIQILAFMSGRNASVHKDIKYRIYISSDMSSIEPLVGGLDTAEKIIDYDGKVYCITVPNHTFLTRLKHKYVWTSNSSRAGQKGVCGITLRDSDMPFTKDGIRPGIIVNPHAIPSRMTIGQLYESMNGNWCAKKGTHTDATIFKKIDIESMADELEKLGLNRYGYHRLYSGLTGEFIDCLIFMGPTYYQRLQKFVIDTVYSVSHGPSDSLSRQPLDGKSSGGGLKIGEMERDVLCAHGASKFLQEKFFDHSDGFTEYICRCGKAAIVNNEKGVYKCKYCKDNADIYGIPTSWSSKLFMQEMETMNVGIKRQPVPFTYETIKEE